MQCGKGIQWLLRWLSGYLSGPGSWLPGNRFSRSFCILFKAYYYCYYAGAFLWISRKIGFQVIAWMDDKVVDKWPRALWISIARNVGNPGLWFWPDLSTEDIGFVHRAEGRLRTVGCG